MVVCLSANIVAVAASGPSPVQLEDSTLGLICTDVTLEANAPEQVLWIGPRNVAGGTASGVSTSGIGAGSALDQLSSQRYAGPVTYHTAAIEARESFAAQAVPKVSTTIEAA